MFYGPVRVPYTAAKGTAKIKVSFAAWKDQEVATGEAEIPVVEIDKAKEQEEKTDAVLEIILGK